MIGIETGAVIASALGALLVLSVGLTDGGYYGSSYTALSVLLGAVALLTLLTGVAARPSRAGAAMLGVLGLLAAWTAASVTWSVPHAAVGLEVRRGVLYLVAFAAIALVVDGRRRLPFLAGLLAGIVTIALVAVAMRLDSGAPVDRFYGSLLEEPVGYPNALGVLMAMGVVLAAGLAAVAPGMSPHLLSAAAPFLVFVLGLTGSRGGALALGLGVAALVLFAPSVERRRLVSVVVTAVAVGGLCWAVVQWRGAEGAGLTMLGIASVALGWVSPAITERVGGRGFAALACALLVGAVVVVALRPPALSSSYRTDYWRAAVSEWGERPLLGSGAGSFFLDWREHRTIDLDVRDAHSLYVEALSELGPMGLVLVLVLVSTPLAVAGRWRGDPLTGVAAGAFVVFAVHAGIDWDWEMPVVTLAGLGCAGAVIARLTGETGTERRKP